MTFLLCPTRPTVHGAVASSLHYGGHSGSAAIRVQSPAGSFRVIVRGNRAEMMPLVGGFSRGSPISPPLHSGAAPYSPKSPSSALNTSTKDVTGRELLSAGIPAVPLQETSLAATLPSPCPHHSRGFSTLPLRAEAISVLGRAAPCREHVRVFLTVELQAGHAGFHLAQQNLPRFFLWKVKFGGGDTWKVEIKSDPAFLFLTPVAKQPNIWSSARMQGYGKREIPEKTRRPAASSGTIPTCESSRATPPGIEPGSRRWEASSLTTTPPLTTKEIKKPLTTSLLGRTFPIYSEAGRAVQRCDEKTRRWVQNAGRKSVWETSKGKRRAVPSGNTDSGWAEQGLIAKIEAALHLYVNQGCSDTDAGRPYQRLGTHGRLLWSSARRAERTGSAHDVRPRVDVVLSVLASCFTRR
ncbi:hypothetical protein PR048_032606 [Dryococelus australis]|uniref:Uncharacterized protein n=1 Tax=Dryococelus australis TaxID=614101 RepID=A0ABQ9G2N8_9NEOP|nr:hypothetical protein PR048_032606 [Dryococelus australis]